jgi:hypothetical protein
MRIHNRSFLKIILIVISTLIALVLIIAASFLIYSGWAKAHQITSAHANQICENFYQDVHSQITSVTGYAIVNSKKNCEPQKDESGFTDYVLSVEFKVTKDGNNTVAGMKNNLDYLKAHLPRKSYPVIIDNIQSTPPTYICVYARRTIDNDGTDYTSGPGGPQAGYTAPGSVDDFAPCGDL